MKVLQVINSLGAGGAEKLVVDTTLLYKDKGIDIEVLLLNHSETPLYRRLNKNQNIKIHSLNSKSVYNPLNIFKIKLFLKKYDIIHVHLFPASYWVSLANLIAFKKSSIVFTEHSTYNKRRGKIITTFADRIIYKQFIKIITISEAVDKNLKKHLGSNFNNYELIHNGIDLEKINTATPYLKNELGFNEADKILIQVSSFRFPKDQFTIIKALKKLPSNIKLILAGDGPLKIKVENLVNELNLSDRVKFLGVRNDIPKLLKSVDIVILASHYEGLSLSCIEGMASGKPFIASNTPGLGDIVKGSGLLFEDSDYNELSTIIIKLLNDEILYKRVVSKCLIKSKSFDIKAMISKYLKIYDNLYKK